MDPLTFEDLLKRKKRNEHYKYYQNHLDALDAKEGFNSTGKLNGKSVKVKSIDSNASLPIINLFNHTFHPKS